MKLNLKDKVVVVTGGAQGIGRAMVTAYLAEGCKAAICDINEKALEDAKLYFKELGYDVMTAVVNVCDNEGVTAFAKDVAKEYGRLDIWVNNAGILHPESIPCIVIYVFHRWMEEKTLFLSSKYLHVE